MLNLVTAIIVDNAVQSTKAICFFLICGMVYA